MSIFKPSFTAQRMRERAFWGVDGRSQRHAKVLCYYWHIRRSIRQAARQGEFQWVDERRKQRSWARCVAWRLFERRHRDFMVRYNIWDPKPGVVRRMRPCCTDDFVVWARWD